MTKSEKLESNLVGVAGEYLVAAELTLRGHVASITLRNSRGIDVIASSADGSKSANFQVKSNSSGKPSWILNRKSESFFAENHYYVFVALGELGSRPNFYVVPSEAVARYLRADHAKWMSGTKRDGSPRSDSSMRKFDDPSGEYLERWDLIDL